MEPDSRFMLIKRHEWNRDPLPPPEIIGMTKPHRLWWFDKALIRGTQPLVYAALHVHVNKIMQSTANNPVPLIDPIKLQILRSLRSYTHGQIFWTTIALSGLFVYQQKRKLSRVALICWGLTVFAAGLAGLLACWIATRRKKGAVPPEIDLTPRQPLIAE